MPLTPEDVQNVEFGKPALGKRGYNEDEVDDFIDEVYDEMVRLTKENEELRGKLAACQRSLATAQDQARSAASAPPTQRPPAPAPVPQRAPAPVGSAQPAEQAAGILALAQRTADEHVAEAKSQAGKIIGEAQNRADALHREAEDQQRRVLGALETQRHTLERKVEELRAFEREYRSRLKSYLEGQLRDLESRAPSDGAPGGEQAGLGSRQSPFAPAQPHLGNNDRGYTMDDGPERR